MASLRPSGFERRRSFNGETRPSSLRMPGNSSLITTCYVAVGFSRKDPSLWSISCVYKNSTEVSTWGSGFALNRGQFGLDFEGVGGMLPQDRHIDVT